MIEYLVAITNLYCCDNAQSQFIPSYVHSLTCEQVIMKLLSSSVCVKGYSCEVVSVGQVTDQLHHSMRYMNCRQTVQLMSKEQQTILKDLLETADANIRPATCITIQNFTPRCL